MVIQDWTSLIISSFQNLWVGAVEVLGKVIGALIVLLVGLIIASGIGALVEQIVKAIKLDKGLRSLGVEEYFNRAGLELNSSKFFGKLVYWFLVVVFLLAVSDILGFYALSDFLRQVLLYLPNVVVAVLIMLAAVVIANFLRHLVKASVKSAGLHAAGFLSTLTWWSVIIFGLLAALLQLGIAVSIINTLITGLIAMFALAGGLAFGLGGKEYASHLINKLREHVEHRN